MADSLSIPAEWIKADGSPAASPHPIGVTRAAHDRVRARLGAGRRVGRGRQSVLAGAGIAGCAARALHGLPLEAVRVREVPGIAGENEAVRSGALRGDAGVLRQRATPVEAELDRTVGERELDVATEALPH